MTSRTRDVPSVDSWDEPSPRVRVTEQPSLELLDRALAGWERFLDTFEGAFDE
ncbi:hypothetical protein [Streptomyces racemochromogenes]|uniref:hypothetical protein n=1 Tax=Streptomyces racemochromogenes TaxID=67353 RepID=UPI0026896C53